jgi:hemerythrin-like domain-containing protein
MMAVVHNILLRGLNAIYQQAPFVPASEVPNFLQYCEAWAYTTHAHHDNEENTEFPLIEKLTKEKGIMERNIVQHKDFLPGLTEFEEYVQGCKEEGRLYDGNRLKQIVEKFGGLLQKHLADEIETLEDLDKFKEFDWTEYHNVTHKASKGTVDKVGSHSL